MKKESAQRSRKKDTKESTPSNGNAVELLKADHEKVKKLFTQLESGAASDQKNLAEQIFNELDVHATLEEEIFYPAVRDQVDPEDLVGMEEGDEDEDEEVDEDAEGAESSEELGEGVIAVAYEEHKAARELIRQLRGMDPASEPFKELLAELKEDVLDHASEEEDVVFPAALLKLDVEGLGAQMRKRKSELTSTTANT